MSALPENVSFDDYVAIDDGVLVCGQLTDDEIIASVQRPEGQEDDSCESDAEEPPPRPSPAEASAVLDGILKKKLSSLGLWWEMYFVLRPHHMAYFGTKEGSRKNGEVVITSRTRVESERWRGGKEELSSSPAFTLLRGREWKAVQGKLVLHS
ncbi:hypothetical protein HPB47_002475 [Ixodes persulcatus]|uniref:Uncharacterized protein n=1 Tax=Ixodes persulcatus TaxID=34615 RepID=A0AC60PM37_IXOPE|nr:hypothetical protein HPB47_002475 [Ixodes persulcatus]